MSVDGHRRLDKICLDVAVLPCERPFILQFVGVVAEGLRRGDNVGCNLSLGAGVAAALPQKEEQA